MCDNEATSRASAESLAASSAPGQTRSADMTTFCQARSSYTTLRLPMVDPARHIGNVPSSALKYTTLRLPMCCSSAGAPRPSLGGAAPDFKKAPPFRRVWSQAHATGQVRCRPAAHKATCGTATRRAQRGPSGEHAAARSTATRRDKTPLWCGARHVTYPAARTRAHVVLDHDGG